LNKFCGRRELQASCRTGYRLLASALWRIASQPWWEIRSELLAEIKFRPAGAALQLKAEVT
jgi:hypothetical protein